MATAQRIAEPHDLEVWTHSGLIDIDYGRWQGLTPEEVAERWPTELDAWYSSPQRAEIPEGDSLREVRERAMKTVQDLIRQHGDREIILVAHTVVNRIILLGVLGLGNERFWRLAQEPCAINTFTVENGEFTLVCLNDTCHLEDLS
jgi:probable phosphoglycerate mutase